MPETFESVLERLRQGEKLILERMVYKKQRIPFRTIFFRDDKWYLRRVTEISGDQICREEIEIYWDEVKMEVRAYLQRERAKRKRRR